jgi:nitrogen fixation protein FixH
MSYRPPPHLTWPLFVVALLLLGIGSTMTILLAARSDGGAQVIEDYYQKAASWELAAAEQAASAALGWRLEVDVQSDAAGPALRRVDLRFADRFGVPVAELRGVVRAFRPERAALITESPLTPVEGVPGLYRQVMLLSAHGLWDLEIAAVRDSSHFFTRVRRDLP